MPLLAISLQLLAAVHQMVGTSRHQVCSLVVKQTAVQPDARFLKDPQDGSVTSVNVSQAPGTILRFSTGTTWHIFRVFPEGWSYSIPFLLCQSLCIGHLSWESVGCVLKGLFPFLDACYYFHPSRAISSVSGTTLCGRPGSWPHSKLQFLLKSKHWKWLHELIPAIIVESAADGKETGSATANDGAKTTPSTAADVGRSCKFTNSLFYMENIVIKTIEKKAKTGRRKPPKTSRSFWQCLELQECTLYFSALF